MNSEVFADEITRSRRLATLRVLKENEGSANESVLRVALHQLGFRGRNATDDGLRNDAEFLHKAELVTKEYYQGRVRTLVLTERGLSFLHRRVDPIPGIDYPDIA